jgi:DNA-directed RNA polymerase subunit RPC12/RpoP
MDIPKEIQWEQLGNTLRYAKLDGGRELLDKTGAREMTLRFAEGPVIAEAQQINRRWVVYPDCGSRELFARRVHFDRKVDAVEYLVELRELDTTSREARFCDIATHDWMHVGGVRNGEVFLQQQRCARCSAKRQLQFNLVNGELLGEQ